MAVGGVGRGGNRVTPRDEDGGMAVRERGVGGVVDVEAALRALVGLDVAGCDADGLATASSLVARVQGFLDVRVASIAQRAGELCDVGRCAPADEVLARGGRLSGREARRVSRRAGVLSRVPALSEALASGVISGGHADALASAVAGLGDRARDEVLALDERLAERAAGSSPERFGEYCRRVARDVVGDEGVGEFERQRRATRLAMFRSPVSGMFVLRAEFDPELGARVSAAIEAEVDALRRDPRPGVSGVVEELALDREHLGAHALARLVAAGHGEVRPAVADMLVMIDEATLRSGVHPGTVSELGDGSELAVGVVRRLACEARWIPVVLGGEGEVLDVGRSRRLATRGQRRALRAMYRSCAWGGCEVRFGHCQIHHIDPWEQGGSSDLELLVPLCSLHHHLVHEGGWTIRLDPGRVLVATRPDGIEHARTPVRHANDHDHGHDAKAGPPDARPPGAEVATCGPPGDGLPASGSPGSPGAPGSPGSPGSSHARAPRSGAPPRPYDQTELALTI